MPVPPEKPATNYTKQASGVENFVEFVKFVASFFTALRHVRHIPLQGMKPVIHTIESQ